MSASDVVELALEAYRESARALLAASAPSALLTLAGFMFFWSYAFPLFWSTRSPDNIDAQVGEAAVAMALAMFVAAPIMLFGVAYTAALTTQIVADFMVGNVPNVSSARASATRSTGILLKLLLRQLLTGGVFFVISVGLLLLSAGLNSDSSDLGASALAAGTAVITFIVGLAFAPAVMVRDALIPSVAVVEGKPVRESIRRGRDLIGSNIGAPLLAVVLIAFLFLVFGLGVSSLDAQLGLGEWIADTFVGAALHDLFTAAFAYVPWYIVLWVSVPVWSTVCTILYFERRVSREGFDIEVLAQDVWRNTPGHRFQL